MIYLFITATQTFIISHGERNIFKWGSPSQAVPWRWTICSCLSCHADTTANWNTGTFMVSPLHPVSSPFSTGGLSDGSASAVAALPSPLLWLSIPSAPSPSVPPPSWRDRAVPPPTPSSLPDNAAHPVPLLRQGSPPPGWMSGPADCGCLFYPGPAGDRSGPGQTEYRIKLTASFNISFNKLYVRMCDWQSRLIKMSLQCARMARSFVSWFRSHSITCSSMAHKDLWI